MNNEQPANEQPDDTIGPAKMPKLCIDCKWVRLPQCETTSLHNIAECGHPNVCSLVDATSLTRCSELRVVQMYRNRDEEPCGLTAEWFEPRPTPADYHDRRHNPVTTWGYVMYLLNLRKAKK